MKIKFTFSLISIVFAILLIDCTDPVTDAGLTKSSSSGLYSISDSRGASSSSGNGGDSTAQYQPGVITAGEWNDNAHWDYWSNLLSNPEYLKGLNAWEINPLSRIPIQLKDSNGRSLIDASIEVKDNEGKVIWQCRTDNFGKAVAWPNLFFSTVSLSTLTVNYFGNTFTFDASSLNANQNTFTIPISRNQIINADIAFVVDATGSMGDELEYLKVELNDVLARAAQNNCSAWRMGSVFYRDAGDEYLTRVSPFTTNPANTINFIKEQRADGGGDWPEAVHAALNEAVNTLKWSSQARARLLFLVLDAPPHEEANIIASLKSRIAETSEKGIKIIPIVASGIDKNTEFLMRSWSLATNGTYVFITNDSGIGNDHLVPTVGDYKVEKLNDLMVRLIYQYTSCTSE